MRLLVKREGIDPQNKCRDIEIDTIPKQTILMYIADGRCKYC
jgi:hypothetical protein